MADLTKIISSDYENVGIHSKNNPLGLSVTEAKAAFDELSVNVIIPKINSNVDVTNNRFAADESTISSNNTNLQSQIIANASQINTNKSNIATNTANIQTNTNNIASNTAQTNTNKTNIASNTANIVTNAANITANANNIIALGNNVLKKDNTIAYTPTNDYNPATRKFVTDSVQNAGGGDMLSTVYDKNQKRTDIYDWAQENFSNPNLLINTNFKNAVNQRGQSSYSVPNVGNYVYTIDRWRMVRANLSVSSAGVALNRYSGTDYGSFQTLLEENYNGSKVALSCRINGIIYSGTGTITTTLNNVYVALPFGYVRTYVTAEAGGNTIVEFITTSDTAYTIEWVKLELGSVATPFVPRSYGEELALCRRTCRVFDFPSANGFMAKFALTDGSTTTYCVITNGSFGVEMRTIPTVTVTNSSVYTFEVADTGLTFSMVGRMNTNGVNTILVNGVLADGVYLLGGKFIFDAEIY